MSHDVATRRVLYEIPGMQTIQPDQFEFTGVDGQLLAAAIYLPANASKAPVTIVIEGYPDAGFAKFFGCRFMDMQWSISLAQLLAASGIAAVTYTNSRPGPDAAAIIDRVTANADTLKIDPTRIALWATSGHGPVALSVLERARCAVLSNPFTFDVDGATHVAEAAKMFRFEAPLMGTLAEGRPLFLIRSGRDEMPGLNAALDLFVTHALRANHPVTVVNHPDAPHSFELYHDSRTTRAIIRQALSFLREQLVD